MTKPSCTALLILLLLLLPLVEFASANPFHFGKPKVTLLSPLTDHVYNQSSIPINVLVYMFASPAWVQLSWMKYSLDGHPDVGLAVTNEAISDGYNGYGTGALSGLPRGPHSLYIHGETIFTENSHTYHSFNVTVYFVVDIVDPTIQVLSPQPKTYDSISVPLQFQTDKRMSWTGYSLDQSPVVTSQSSSTLDRLSNGLHSLRIYGRGVVGDIYASEKVVFNINGKKPPTVTLDIDAILHARPYLPSDFRDMTYWKLIFGVSEPPTWTAYCMDEGGNQTIEGNIILRLSYGTHTIIVYAKDYCGNAGASTPYTFTLNPSEAGSAYPSHSPIRSPMPKPSSYPTSTNSTHQLTSSNNANPKNPLNQQPLDGTNAIDVGIIVALFVFIAITCVLVLRIHRKKTKVNFLTNS